MNNKYYKLKRIIHLMLIIIFIPIMIISGLAKYAEQETDAFFDKIRIWVGYEEIK